MDLDQTDNFVRGSTVSSTASGDTVLDVSDGSVYPDPANGEYNLVFWDVNSYPRPDQDPDVEIVRVTARDTTNNQLTVQRSQEDTVAASHPSGSALQLAPTAKMFTDIQNQMQIGLLDVAAPEDLPDPSTLTKPTIAYVDSEDDYVGVFKQ